MFAKDARVQAAVVIARQEHANVGLAHAAPEVPDAAVVAAHVHARQDATVKIALAIADAANAIAAATTVIANQAEATA